MRKSSKGTRIDLWLDEADLSLLRGLAQDTSATLQRVIEVALSHTRPDELPSKMSAYKRVERVSFNMDGLAIQQLDRLVAASGLRKQDVLRVAIRRLATELAKEHG
ncbi:MAG: hypothetical protein AAF639_14710 [Chloroflexota bacterium]